MSKLTVLVLCGRSPRHLYVANKICEAAEPLAIVHEVGRDLSFGNLKKNLRPRLLFSKIRRKLGGMRSTSAHDEGVYFFGDAPPELTHPELVTEVPHINHPDVLALTKQLQPDLIAVFGTSLIRGALLEQGRLGIVNLHGGLSPDYRGADCTFWALYNNEPETVGFTLHYIDPGIDTGNLIAHIRPGVHETDGEQSLFWRGAKLSADVYAELLRRIALGERFGQTQPHKGRLYQFKHRTAGHEAELERALVEGRLKRVELPHRIDWFPAPSPEHGAGVVSNPDGGRGPIV